MGRIPMVKCPRCGNEFSALRAECPNCGLRRTIGDGTSVPVRAERPRKRQVPPKKDTPRSNWQLLAAVILVIAAILAAALMILSGSSRGGGLVRTSPTPSPVLTTMAPRPTPSPSPTPTVNSIKLFFLTKEITAEEGGFTMYVGDAPLTISARAYPNDKLSDARFTWRVSDNSKAKLTPSEDTQSCEVLVLESAGGYITLTVSCYGVDYSVPLYIWSRD